MTTKHLLATTPAQEPALRAAWPCAAPMSARPWTRGIVLAEHELEHLALRVLRGVGARMLVIDELHISICPAARYPGRHDARQTSAGLWFDASNSPSPRPVLGRTSSLRACRLRMPPPDTNQTPHRQHSVHPRCRLLAHASRAPKPCRPLPFLLHRHAASATASTWEAQCSSSVEMRANQRAFCPPSARLWLV